MKKKMICRGLLGFPLGIAIGYVITIIVSAGWANGCYAAVTPELLEMMGSEINAVILQAILCGVVGSAFAAASLIWEIDSWSIAKQSGAYFATACAAMFPISYLAGWMPHSIDGIISYIGIFIGIFAVAWIGQYLSFRWKINKMNDAVKKANSTK